MRRLEGKHLALLRQRGLHRVQGRAAASGQDQLRGLVADHASVAGNVEILRLDHAPHKLLGAAGDDGQRRAIRNGRIDAGLEVGGDVGGVGHDL